MKNIKLVIFDLDGTIIDAYTAIAESFNFTMRKLDLPPKDSEIIKMSVGWGLEGLLMPYVGKRNINKASRIYSRHHASELLKTSKLLPGAKSTLEYLYSKGYALAVASNRPTKFSLMLLDKLSIKKYFRYVLCADKLKNAKPHPEILIAIMHRLRMPLDNTLYVGDMAIDIQAGRAAGVKTVAVLGGSSTTNEIKQQRPNRILRDIAALKNVL